MCWKQLLTTRSNHRRCPIKELALQNFAKFRRKHMCWSLFFNKVADLRPQVCLTLLKKRLRQRRFPLNFVKFLRTPFSQNTSEQVLLTALTKAVLENFVKFPVTKSFKHSCQGSLTGVFSDICEDSSCSFLQKSLSNCCY